MLVTGARRTGHSHFISNHESAILTTREGKRGTGGGSSESPEHAAQNRHHLALGFTYSCSKILESAGQLTRATATTARRDAIKGSAKRRKVTLWE